MNWMKKLLGAAGVLAAALLGTGTAEAATTVNLTAQRASLTLPDGTIASMWSYCGTAVAGGAGTTVGGACPATTNAFTGLPLWTQGPTIVVPAGDALTVALSNSLPSPTSIVILGQMGGGLGLPNRAASPTHGGAATTTEWSQVSGAPAFAPPGQGARMRSFVPEADGVGSTTTTATYTWNNLKPGTYIYESGSRPSLQVPMGLYGVLVVTSPQGTATALPLPGTPGVAYAAPVPGSTTGATAPLLYDADATYLFSEVDVLQNAAVDTAAVAMAASATPSAANSAFAALEQRVLPPAGPGTLASPNYVAPSPACSGSTAAVACYPPAVNYAPTYFLVNGQSYDPSNPNASAQIISDTAGTTAATATGRVLVRLLNAGLKTHIPTLVGFSATLVAEDGNLLPDVALALGKTATATPPLLSGKIQSAMLMTAGKTMDVVIAPAAGTATGTLADAVVPVIDRELSLSGGGKSFSGLQAYLAIAPPGTAASCAATATGCTVLGATGSSTAGLILKATIAANNDTFYVPAGANSYTGNVLINDVGITSVKSTGATGGTVLLAPDGSFIFLAATGAAIPDQATFNYSGIGSDGVTYSAVATLRVTATTGDTVTAPALTFNSRVSSLLRVPHPGVLAGAGSTGNYSLYAMYAATGAAIPSLAPTAGNVLPSTSAPCTPTGTATGTCTVSLLADGSFTATATAPGTYTFPFYVVDAQGKSAASTATVVFPAGSGVQVSLQDSVIGGAAGTDYRWVIEEDQTFLHDPGNAGFIAPAFMVNLSGITLSANPVTGVLDTVSATFSSSAANFAGINPGTYLQVNSSVDALNGVFRINTVNGSTTQAANGALLKTGTLSFTLWLPAPAGTVAPGTATATTGQSLATNFHRSYMPVLAAGCTGPASCNDAQTISGLPLAATAPRSFPADVQLDPTKRYFISVLPGDAGAPVLDATKTGHSMGGAPVVATASTSAAGVVSYAWNAVNVLVPVNPIPPGQMSIFVFEDNSPVSGDVDDNEPGLGGFEVVIYDTRGSSGDQAGQITYDLFNQPLTNSLANVGGTGTDSKVYPNLCPTTPNGKAVPIGVIYTCLPVYQTDAKGNFVLDASGNKIDISPYTGMALVKNVIPGRLDVQAHPAAWREGAGENWIQVSTLEGTPNNDTFVHAGEPAYWQEFGPPGFHSFIGFLNPDHVAKVNIATHDRLVAANLATPFGTVSGRITNLHMDRPPQAKLNDSCQPGTTDASCARAALNYTQCYVALNSGASGGGVDAGPTIAFSRCNADGTFTLSNVPPDTYELFIWDEWLDQIKAKQLVVIPATAAPGFKIAVGDVPVFNWFTRIEETIYLDVNGNGVRDPGEPGLTNLVANVRFRDGTFSNKLVTDAQGNATHNELFPLFNWYVLENDQTRYKNTGVHIIYDAGGVPDQTALGGARALAGSEYFSTLGVINTTETFAVPAANRIPGAKYGNNTTERIDPPGYITEGMQGFINQTEFVEWGKQPFAPGENGGISGMVYFASVRAFDDPRLKVQNLSEPGIPRAQVNLYKHTVNADGTTSDVLIDTTTSTSWDDWANGSTGGTPNMSCPGNAPGSANPPAYVAGSTDPFINYTLGANNQYKCYDGQHAFNQVQPAVYDGYYAFPTSACIGCTQVAITNNAGGLLINPDGTPAPTVTTLPPGQYVVEVVRPDGFEMVKEEDKNILIGDVWIAAAPQQFGSPVNIFILPDQATVNDNNPQGYSMVFPPCVGVPHLVPDFLTVVPEAAQVAPFAGQTRNLCDRKLVTLHDQEAAGGDFQLWTPAPIAGHVAGLMLNDAAAEFDPYSPSFGEKFALPNAPISVRDFNGTEILRAYTDKWGTFDFLNVSTWEANVPNPSGYAPNMLTYCMNDPGPTPVPGAAGKFQSDPYYNSQYSDFCYNWPILPGVTTYLDTPVLPVSAFASHYTPVDCQYADATPGVKRVDGNWIPVSTRAFVPTGATLPATPVGPYVDVAAATPQLTITALGDVSVLNPAYSGPTALPGSTYATNRITRHYGFGAGTGTVQLLTQAGAIQATLATPIWNDAQIVATVPATVPVGTYQLVIKSSTGVSSVDTVSVTVDNHTLAGYHAPWYVAAPPPGTGLGLGQGFGIAHPIQDAIDNPGNSPGDLVIVDAGTYPELDILWKPLRLQGVGAASVTIQATKYPNSKIADWRSRINLLFGLDAEGNQLTDAAGNILPAQIDPLPGQEITGGITRLEPSALSTEEGAGITVLAADHQADTYVITHPKRPRQPGEDPRNNPTDPTCLALDPLATTPAPTPLQNWLAASPYGFYPTGTANPPPGVVLPTHPNTPVGATEAKRRYSDFACYPSRIDGISVTGSDAGGGIYVNGWAHYLQISNNRVFGNSGPYSGGVRVGQPYLEAQTINPATGALSYDFNVSIHHNAIITNGTDEANSAPGSPVGTSGAGGGLAIEAGSDNFTVANNWICGNFSAGDGGGVGILGNSLNGSVVNNSIIFNEAYQQTGANYGGGLVVEGEPGTPSTGVGNILIDSNLIQGNSVRSGSGGGVRLASINGTELTPTRHYTATVTNNVIVNNVAGWAGAGISIVDTLYSVVEENTITNNDAVGISAAAINTAIAGIPVGPTTAVPSPAGIASEGTSPSLQALITAAFSAAQRPAAVLFSQPRLRNNVVYQNRSFFYDGSTGTARLCVGNNWSLAGSHSCTQLAAQATTGQCVPGAAYWELGVLGESSPSTTLAMTYGITSAAYTGTGNKVAAPGFVKSYCNGGAVAPEAAFEPGSPFQPSALGNMTLAATLDESGNYVDLSFGPLSLRDPAAPGTVNGIYDIVSTGGAFNAGTPLGQAAPFNHDIHGTPRPQLTRWDIGAVELSNSAAAFVVNSTTLAFGPQLVRTTSPVQYVTVTNTGTTAGPLGIGFTGPFARGTAAAGTNGTCGGNLAGGASCTVGVTFTPTAAGPAVGTVTVGGVVVGLTGTGVLSSVTVTPTTLAFGAQNVGTTSAAQLVTITNTGTLAQPLTFNKTGSGQYVLVNGCPASLLAGNSCTLSVTFAAATPLGAKAGNIAVVYPGAITGNTTVNVALTGTAGRPALGLTDPNGATGGTFNFGTGITTRTATFTLTNNGANAAAYVVASTAVAKTNGGLGTYSITGGSCVAGTTVAAGGTCTVIVQFATTSATSTTNATLTVSGTAAGLTTVYNVARTLTGQ